MAGRQIFRVLLRMEIRTGMEDEFERTWMSVGDSVTSHPANLGQSLSRGSGDDEGSYFITSDWVDEAGFRAFETSERHLEHRRMLHPYRSGGAMSTMRVVAELPGGNGALTHEEWAGAS